jgi:hypothetical protein
LPAAAREYTAANLDYTRFGGTDFRQFASNPGTVLSMTGVTLGAIPRGQDGTNLTPDQLIAGAVNYTDNVSTVDVVPYQKHHNAFVSTGVSLGERWDLSLDGRWSKRDFELGDIGSTGTFYVPASNAFSRAPPILTSDRSVCRGSWAHSGISMRRWRMRMRRPAGTGRTRWRAMWTATSPIQIPRPR